MIRKFTMMAAMLLIALPAAADFQTVSRAYEVALSDLTVPLSQNGQLLFRQCNDCDTESVRLTPNTQFVVNGRNVRFDRFRSIANETSEADSVPVTVLHHLESGTVVRLSLTVK